MKTSWQGKMAVVLGALAVFTMLGCDSYWYDPIKINGGPILRTHSKMSEGGYYMDFDKKADSIEITPVEDWNPVRTQHVLIVTVKDKDGNPLPSRRVEWFIPEGSVGTFVEVDESGWLSSRGHKIDNTFAISHTNENDHVLTRGNDDPSDDIHLKRGQTWAVITSPIEGDTHVVAYAPAIYNWDKHKVFAIKHWHDIKVQFPPDAVNPVGTPHTWSTRVSKMSDDTPKENYDVTYEVVSGPAATFDKGNAASASVKTGSQGDGVVTMNQTQPVEGANEVLVTVYRPASESPGGQRMKVASKKVVKRWIAPAIAIVKTGPSTAGVNAPYTYNINVSSTGNMEATNVKVTDTLPAGLKYVSSNPAATVNGQNLAWSLGTIEKGASRALSVTVQATQAGKVTNCANVTADMGLKGQSCVDTLISAPKLGLVKTAPAEVMICDPIEYKITVQNTGGAAATNVQISDDLPDGVKTTDGKSQVTATIDSLEPNTERTVTFRAMASKPGTFTNNAQVTADGGHKATAQAKTVVRQPVLVVTKSGPAKRFVDTNATYDITVTNKGDAVAESTQLSDQLPAGASFVSATDGGQLSGGSVVWNLGSLAPNASKKVSLTVKMTAKGTAKNTVTATARCASAVSDDASTDVTGIPAILLEMVDSPDPIEVGGTTTYTVTVTNQGSADGTGIVIAATLPAEQSVQSVTGPTKETVAGKKVTFAALGNLAPKATATYKITVKCEKPGDVRFEVTLTSDQTTSPVRETESTHIYQ